jgi:hypothetical protein
MHKGLLVQRTVTALAFAVVLASATSAGAATKPARDDVPPGATVLYFTGPPTPSSGTSTTKVALKVTNPTVIAKIRDLINSLPVSDTRHEFCPADLLIPSYVSFARNAATTPFARVMFQLGGCPFARVYVHGVAVSPALGGPHLGVVFSQIKRLVEENS